MRRRLISGTFGLSLAFLLLGLFLSPETYPSLFVVTWLFVAALLSGTIVLCVIDIIYTCYHESYVMERRYLDQLRKSTKGTKKIEEQDKLGS